jgi:multicomponent Na+:H+ antiporter subunit E
MRALTGRLPYLAYLVVVWVTLWGDVSAANVLSGLVVGGGLLLAFPTAGPQRIGTLRPLQALRFVVYFLYKLVEANVIVAWEVITPNNASVTEGIVEVPVTGASDAVLTTVANAVSLTPGTITIEVRRQPATLWVHVLHLRSIERTRREILNLERLALDAFGSEEAVAAARELRRSLGARVVGDAEDAPPRRTT